MKKTTSHTGDFSSRKDPQANPKGSRSNALTTNLYFMHYIFSLTVFNSPIQYKLFALKAFSLFWNVSGHLMGCICICRSPSALGKDGVKRMMFFKPCSQVLNVPSIWLLPAEVWIKFWFPMWSHQMVGSKPIISLQQNSLDTDSNHKICWKLDSRII